MDCGAGPVSAPRRFFFVKEDRVGDTLVRIASAFIVFACVGYTGAIAAAAFFDRLEAGEYVVCFFAFCTVVFALVFLAGLAKSMAGK